MPKNNITSDHSLVIGLDIGTSSVRAIAFDIQGNPKFESQVKYSQTVTRDGGVETDADALVSHTAESVSRLLRKAGKTRGSIVGVGISCFWHSLIGVGSKGVALTPIYSWADTRASVQAARLTELFDREAYHVKTGCELHTCFWPAKIKWLTETQPDIVKQVVRWVGFGEYLLLRLFGHDLCSFSTASGTGLFDPEKNDWDDDVLGSLGIERSQLSPLTELTPISGLIPAYRRELSALGDVPWFPAVGDGACSNIGSGGTDSRRIVLNVGTSAALRVVTPVASGQPLGIGKGLFCYRVDGTSVVFGGAFANGGNAHAWLKDMFKWSDDKRFDQTVARIQPDSHGLTVMPFWAGERSPGWHSGAKASILGMNLRTTSADMVRATLEACAYSFDDTRQSLRMRFPDAEEIVVSGGAIAESPLFGHIICDVFGEPISESRVTEASSRGAAMFAQRGVGFLKDLSDAPFKRGRVFKPNKEHHKIYSGALDRYRSYYRKLIEG